MNLIFITIKFYISYIFAEVRCICQLVHSVGNYGSSHKLQIRIANIKSVHAKLKPSVFDYKLQGYNFKNVYKFMKN